MLAAILLLLLLDVEIALTASSRVGAADRYVARPGPPSMRRVAMWRITPSSILSTREISSSVSGVAA